MRQSQDALADPRSTRAGRSSLRGTAQASACALCPQATKFRLRHSADDLRWCGRRCQQVPSPTMTRASTPVMAASASAFVRLESGQEFGNYLDWGCVDHFRREVGQWANRSTRSCTSSSTKAPDHFRNGGRTQSGHLGRAASTTLGAILCSARPMGAGIPNGDSTIRLAPTAQPRPLVHR